MAARCRRRAIGAAAWLALALVACEGWTYLRHRGGDAMDMMDIGVKWTKKPHFSANACLLGLGSLGAGRTNGRFAGLGGGRAGVLRQFHRNMGLLVWSYDEVAWGDDFDPEKPETLQRCHIGPVGWLSYPQRRPQYAFG